MEFITEEDINTQKGIESSTICPLPWKQLQVTTFGEVNPCCIWQGKPVGNLHTSEFKDIWNDHGLRSIRREMMKGQKPEGCKKCYFIEELGTPSPRWYAYRKYLSEMEHITDNTDIMGRDSEFKIECWDIRFSNKCNLCCRTCGPGASTAWYPDARKAFGEGYVDSVIAKVNNHQISGKLLDYLLEHLDDVTEIYFVGGEPLIMPEHYEVLKAILERGKKDIYLRYNTNLTTLKTNDKAIRTWLQLKEQGNKIEVGLSLDAIGEVAEYVRHGCNWERVAENLKKLIDNDIHIMVMPTVSILNVWHVQDLIDYLLSLGIKGYDIANANIVVGPEHYDMRILPEYEKNLVIERITKYLEEHENEEEENFGVRHKFFDPILEFFKTPIEHREIALEEFKNITEKLDKIRNQDFSKINSQFSNWKNWK